jgi:hypothetical protein
MILLRIIAVPVTAAVLVAGIWLTGGQLTNEFKVAMWLTAGWIGLAGLVCLVIAVRRRRFALPVLGAYLVTAAIAGVYLGQSVLSDDVVNEAVARPTAPRNAELARGSFEPVEHDASGQATAIRLAGGKRVLTLTDFEVSNGPDLRLYLVAGDARDEAEVDDFRDLGVLKGNIGNQQYELARDLDLGRYRTVVVWCRAFSVEFARAPLAPRGA